jgi:hypothetical protein
MSADLDLEPLFAETRARLAATRARKKAAEEAAKPKIVATVSEKMAEAIKHDPTSLRLSARAEDDTVVVDRPRRTEVMEVVEVDREGRPSRVRRFDCASPLPQPRGRGRAFCGMSLRRSQLETPCQSQRLARISRRWKSG